MGAGKASVGCCRLTLGPQLAYPPVFRGPMAPTPSSGRRALAHKDVTPVLNESPLEQNAQESAFKPIFLDLMMGTALQIFVEKDVDDRENIVQRVQVHTCPKVLIVYVRAEVQLAL